MINAISGQLKQTNAVIARTTERHSVVGSDNLETNDIQTLYTSLRSTLRYELERDNEATWKGERLDIIQRDLTPALPYQYKII